jgi:hypothetical protein
MQDVQPAAGHKGSNVRDHAMQVLCKLIVTEEHVAVSLELAAPPDSAPESSVCASASCDDLPISAKGVNIVGKTNEGDLDLVLDPPGIAHPSYW